jgi:predicted DsbA family dithiol-disulfide isomerase
MTAPFPIDIWSDVVCPFCYLGSRQLALALESFEHRDQVVLRHHAFELDPERPTDLDPPLHELIAEKLNIPIEKARSLHQGLEAQAEELGMTWSLASAKPTNTFDAHRLIALATTQGRGHEMSQRLFQAYFCDGQRISDHDQLNELANDVSVSDAASLWSSDAFEREVRADEMTAREMRITGVPAILIDGKFMVLGAQGADQIAEALRQAWQRRAA